MTILTGRKLDSSRLLATVLAVLCAAAPAAAQGELDPSFGQDGLTLVAFGDLASVVGDGVLVAPDGSVTVVVQGDRATLVRLRPDGSVDPGFGEGGVLEPLSGLRATAAARLDDGRMVIAGRLDETPVLVRLLADGALDPSFVLAGVRPGIGGVDLEVLADGGVLALDDGVWRLDADGRPDPAFGVDGFAALPVLPPGEVGLPSPTALAVQDGGGILVAAERNAAIVRLGEVDRYDADGDLDRGFGGGGRVVVGSDGAQDVVPATGRAALVLERFSVARVGAGGRRDPEFAPPIERSGSGTRTILLDAQGRLLAAGAISLGGGDAPIVQRFLADGGRLVVALGSGLGAQSPGFQALALAPQGAIVAAGPVCREPAACDLLVARVRGERASGVRLSPDGKRQMVVKDVGDERWSIVRNLEDGTVTGNVDADGREPVFLWCLPEGDVPSAALALACFVAPACAAAPCDAFTPAGRVTLPPSFFTPPA